MVTFPQLEALVWIARLGTQEKAARRLNATQPTIAKRIQEFSQWSGCAIFEKTGRQTVLTEKGEQLVELAEEALEIREKMLLVGLREIRPMPKIRIGVTELCAQTWVPRYFRHIRRTRPDMDLDIVVSSAPRLISSLENGDIDLAVCRKVTHAGTIESLHLATVQTAWCISANSRQRIRGVGDLGSATLIAQGRKGGASDPFEQWYRMVGMKFDRVVNADSMTTVISLVLADCGVSILPLAFVAPLVASRQLQDVPTLPKPPDIEFMIHFVPSKSAPHIQELAAEARAYGDFSQVHQT
jgi:DNA-binding transcriptional LysR family regulator